MTVLVDKTCAPSFLIKVGRVFYARGVNYYNLDGGIRTRHAEVDCVQKLKPSKKNKKISMLVIRSTPTQKLCNAKPCQHCIDTVFKVAIKKGYKIHRIYYSDCKGEIVHL
tara:strand:+ start:2746 stop:3075 length:330 start_codon:yes stop_codon:yes gene_type:complete